MYPTLSTAAIHHPLRTERKHKTLIHWSHMAGVRRYIWGFKSITVTTRQVGTMTIFGFQYHKLHIVMVCVGYIINFKWNHVNHIVHGLGKSWVRPCGGEIIQDLADLSGNWDPDLLPGVPDKPAEPLVPSPGILNDFFCWTPHFCYPRHMFFLAHGQ